MSEETLQDQAENGDIDASPPQKYKPDDDELALILAEEWKDKVQFFHGEWHVHENGVWSRRQPHELNMAVRKFLRPFRAQGVTISRRKVVSLAAMAEDDCFVPDREINGLKEQQRKYINMRNGLFNIHTFKLEAHQPELMFTNQLPFEHDESADCPTFKKYLRSSLVHPNGDTDETMIQLVLEAIGYSMTARTDMKASFWLVGKPDSGKSTLVAILRELLGDLHTTIDLNQMGVNRFVLSQIIGKRAVTFTESSSTHMLPDALYKAVVGGSDEIYADVKNKPGVSFVPEAKLWWAMNAPPRISDRSGATFNRLKIILFNRSIPASERIPYLAEKCVEEAAGIFTWVSAYLERLTKTGTFTTPWQSVEWMQNFERENDTERTFVEEQVIEAPGERVQAQFFYDRYRDWCIRNGFRAKNANQASKDWERLGLEKIASGGKRYYVNVRLRDF